jgi:hypothetical protein
MKEDCVHGAVLGAALTAGRALEETGYAPRARYAVECIGENGATKWCDLFSNLVATGGKNDLLTQYFKGSAYTAGWYVGLIDSAGFSAIVAGDTMGSHAGWAESTAYANAGRQSLFLGTASAGSIDNSASTASFNVNASATVKGAFVATSNVKGGTSGTLYSAGTFAANRAVAPGDTLNVTVTLTAS